MRTAAVRAPIAGDSSSAPGPGSLPDLLVIAPITRWEVFGEATPEVRTALDPFGAVYLSHLVGFER